MSDLEKYKRLKKLKEKATKFLSKKDSIIAKIKKDIYLENYRKEYDDNVHSDLKILFLEIKKIRSIKTIVGLLFIITGAIYLSLFLYGGYALFNKNIYIGFILAAISIVFIIVGIKQLKSKRLVAKKQLERFKLKNQEYDFYYSEYNKDFIMDNKNVTNINDIPEFSPSVNFYKPEKYKSIDDFFNNDEIANAKKEKEIEKLNNEYKEIEMEINTLLEELSMPEVFFKNDNFLDMVISIFEENENIKTSKQAIQFVLDTFIELNPIELNSKFIKTKTIKDIVAVANEYFKKDYLPNFL